MAITYADVEKRTGVSYPATGGDFNQANVANFITAAKNKFQGIFGAAPTETNQTHIELVLDYVEIMIHNARADRSNGSIQRREYTRIDEAVENLSIHADMTPGGSLSYGW